MEDKLDLQAMIARKAVFDQDVEAIRKGLSQLPAEALIEALGLMHQTFTRSEVMKRLSMGRVCSEHVPDEQKARLTAFAIEQELLRRLQAIHPGE